MKYPKMPSSRGFQHDKCFAFVKEDGTNVAVDYVPGRGFDGYRLRSREFDAGDPEFGPVIELFEREWAAPLRAVVGDDPVLKADARISFFGEFHGPATFAGNHLGLDERQRAERRFTLFDVYRHGYGFVGPADFLRLFGHLPIAKCVYRGRFTGKLCDDVRKGKFRAQGVAEGVVIKAGKGGDDLEYAKVKTDEYMERLKRAFGERWGEYWE